MPGDKCGGTADRAPQQGGFDLDYYDGLGRQDEVCELPPKQGY